MKIVLLDKKTLGDVVELEQLKGFGEFVSYETTDLSLVVERIKGAEVVITNKVLITKEAMASTPDLKLICVTATGLNNVDQEAAVALNIQVKNVSGYSTESVAQHTFAMLFAFQNHIMTYDQYVKNGDYARNDVFTNILPMNELHGKRFGIIGLGAIGKRVAEIATCFGAEVVYYSTSAKNNDQLYKRLELDDLLSTSDVISIHAPLNAATANLLAYDQISKMRPDAVLINTGRGGIVNEADLAKAIDEDLVGGACFDVFSKEPIEVNNPFLKVKNKHKLLLTPHVAWASIEARKTLILRTIENLSH